MTLRAGPLAEETAATEPTPSTREAPEDRQSWMPLVAISLAISLYSLVMASLMLTGGKLGDIGGAARIFRIGCAVFGLGSLLAGRYGLLTARRDLEIGDTTIDLWGLSPTPLLVLAGAAVRVGFAHWQRRHADRRDTPLLRLENLGNGGFMACASTDTLRQLALAGALFVVPVFTQSTLGFTAIQSGLAVLRFSAMVFLPSMTIAGLGERVAPKWLMIGGLGAFWLGLVLLRGATSADMGLGDFVVPMGVMGVGLGLFVAQIVNVTISQVADDERNEGAGTHNTFRELGSSLGTAVIGAVLLTGIFSNLADGVLRAEAIDA